MRTHRKALRLAVYVNAASQVPAADGRYHTIGSGDDEDYDLATTDFGDRTVNKNSGVRSVGYQRLHTTWVGLVVVTWRSTFNNSVVVNTNEKRSPSTVGQADHCLHQLGVVNRSGLELNGEGLTAD